MDCNTPPVVGRPAIKKKQRHKETQKQRNTRTKQVLAEEHCSYYSEKPSEAKALFTQQLYRSLGLTAHLGWARLLVDRYRDLVQAPAAAGQHTSGARAPHHFTPDDEEAYEHDNFFNPDTTPHQSH